MKVLHVIHGYYPETSGGVEAYLRDLVAAQRALGLEVKLLAGSLSLWDACGLETLEVDGLSVLRLHREDWYFDHYARSYHPDVERLVWEFLDRERPDLLHIHQWIRLTCNLVEIARSLAIPSVVTLHDVYTSCPRAFRLHRDGKPCTRELSVENCGSCVPRFGYESEREVAEGIELFRAQYRAELQLARKVLVAREVTADLLSRTTGLPRRLFTVLDLAYGRRFSGLESGDTGGGPFRLGYWGSLSPHKGTGVLLRAFRAAVQEAGAGLPMQLHLFGPVTTAALKSEFEALAKGLPVTFHGAFVPPELLKVALHAGVFPVLCFETYGMGLAECFEMGLPAIVSNIGALPERAGQAALKVPPGDVQALALAMGELARDLELRARLVARIPPLPPEPEAHAAELMDIYRQASGERREPESISVERIAAWRRSQFLLMQRESADTSLRDLRGRRDPQ